MNQLANPDKLNRDAIYRRGREKVGRLGFPASHLARALESVSNRVTASQVELFSFLL